jgi:diguanylate cyclase (GGDEF)-like protein
MAVGLPQEMLQGLKKNFDPERYNLISIPSVSEFLKAIKREKPNLAFISNNLPGIENYHELFIALRSQPKIETVPILLIAVRQEDSQSKIKLLRTGLIDEYISLPISIEEITARADVYLQKQLLEEELETQNLLLQKLSVMDELTKVFNRRHLIHRLNEEIEKVERYGYLVSCLMVDIDHFKRINHRYGHSRGDQILKELSFLLKKNIRKVDILSRYGGEEFIIILPHINLEGGLIVAEKLRRKVEEYRFGPSRDACRVTISIGVGSFNDRASLDRDSIIQALDKQLYKAKRAGRNRVCGRLYRHSR